MSAIIFSNPRFARIAKMLPLIWTLIALFALPIALRDSVTSRSADISSTESLGERLREWRFYGERYISSNPIEMLIGSGMSEYAESDVPNRYPSAAPIPIDNTFLQLLLQGGLLLLGVMIYYYIQAWRLLYRKANSERSFICLAAAAVFSITPLVAAINDLPIPMFALFTIAMMIRPEPNGMHATRSVMILAGPNWRTRPSRVTERMPPMDHEEQTVERAARYEG
jgi:O-antigen ligase